MKIFCLFLLLDLNILKLPYYIINIIIRGEKVKQNFHIMKKKIETLKLRIGSKKYRIEYFEIRLY